MFNAMISIYPMEVDGLRDLPNDNRWFKGYHSRKWIQQHEFKSRSRLFTFYFPPNALRKGLNHLLPLAMSKLLGRLVFLNLV